MNIQELPRYDIELCSSETFQGMRRDDCEGEFVDWDDVKKFMAIQEDREQKLIDLINTLLDHTSRSFNELCSDTHQLVELFKPLHYTECKLEEMDIF